MYLGLHFLLLWPTDQLHLQSKRQEERVEVLEGDLEGWQTGQDKGSEGQNNGRALWWN